MVITLKYFLNMLSVLTNNLCFRIIYSFVLVVICNAYIKNMIGFCFSGSFRLNNKIIRLISAA